MATVQSLGLREPSALSYVIAESILPVDPAPSSYEWRQQLCFEDGVAIIDEVLTVSKTVVWSRNRTIKRVYNLTIEGEPLLHAFVTHFIVGRPLGADAKPNELQHSKETSEPALVVILKTQAHIYLLSGDAHVLPLPFEVQNVFPLARGFLVQKKSLTGADGYEESSSDQIGLVFKSANDHVSSSEKAPSATDGGPPELRNVLDSRRPASSKKPRTYSYTELLSDLGLVVSCIDRRISDLNDWRTLPADEELIYISASDELDSEQRSQREPLYIAVTTDAAASSMTVWQVVFGDADEDANHGLRSDKTEKRTRRTSSNVYLGHPGVATPLSRAPGTFRESFGGLAQSLSDSFAMAGNKEHNPKQVEDLAAHLGHEFEHTGVQTRSARRVSSMLARTDLTGTNDRNTFNELSLGPAGRKSLGLSARRGDSLGGFGERQSFGRRRSSFQANSSVLSEGTSFLDIPASHLLDGGLNGYNEVDNDDHEDDIDSRPRQIGLIKLKSIHFTHGSVQSTKHERFRVTTMLAPDKSTADERRSRILSICILERKTYEMTVFSLAVKPQLSASRSTSIQLGNEIRAGEVHRSQGIVDICRVKDGSAQRFLALTRTRNNSSMLHLEAPWSAPFRVELPSTYKVFERWASMPTASLSVQRDTGIHRIISASDVTIASFASAGGSSEVLLVDRDQSVHGLQIRLMPSDQLVCKVLQLTNFVFGPEDSDSLLVAWWEVKRWLEGQRQTINLEWTSLTITLFLLAVPFASKAHNISKAAQRQKKSNIPRSSSGATIETEHWRSMSQIHNVSKDSATDENIAWSWLKPDGDGHKIGASPAAKHKRTYSSDLPNAVGKDDFLVRCSNYAREFLQSPAGETAMGPEGYLPVAVNKSRIQRGKALASMLVGLHLLREEQKLQTTKLHPASTSSINLALIISQIAWWLRWPDWSAFSRTCYGAELACIDQWQFDDSVIDSLETPAQPFEPPSIFRHVESVIVDGTSGPFLSLLDLIAQSRHISATHPLYKAALNLTPCTFALVSFLGTWKGGQSQQQVIESMLSCNLDRELIDSLPQGIVAVFSRAITAMRANPVSLWSEQAYELVNRPDLEGRSQPNESRRTAHVMHAHESLRDYRTIITTALDADTVSKWDASSEVDRQMVTKLIFREDRRFQEASRLLNQTRSPVVECVIEPGWTEADLLEAQKELAQHVSRRTFSVAAGRGMMHFNARVPLLTERVPIPAFTPLCVIKPSGAGDHAQAMTFSADKALFTEEKTCWAFFHNGASAGLMISKDAKWIDTSWILYNKPSDLTNRHAGFLLALGLNGHLESLAKWVAFKYLTPKHTMTSVGLLLGLAASYLGTSDTLITRLLSVHVTRLLPQGAAELNLSPLTQTAGLMGIGLLYHNSQHRRMSEVMLSEIENSDAEERSGEEPILRDEGYRLAAGCSLGLINLGHGGSLGALHDMGLVERLLTIAIGPKNVNLVHVLDRATAGAVIAVAFIFMKTNDESVAQKIDIPDTKQQFDYVRPDIFLLRTLARHLIMWDHVQPSKDFIRSSLPPKWQKRASLTNTKRLSTDDLPFFNIVAGICFAISLRFAGSHRTDVRDLLITYLDQFWRISKLPALNYDSKVTLNGVRNCLDVLALSCATVMAGSGDLNVLRRLRALHGRTDPETPFGSHLAAHMALGALFLSGGTATFGTSNLAIATLVIAFYPVFPTDILDNRGHLQALRHFWVLAVDDRCLISRDVETGQVIGGLHAHVTMTDGSKVEIRTPGLLPDLDTVSLIEFNNESYWPVKLSLSAPSQDIPGSKPDNSNEVREHGKLNRHRTIRDDLKSNSKHLSIQLLRRSAYEKPQDLTSTFTTELQALDEERGIPSKDANAAVNERWKHAYAHVGTNSHARNPFDWVFALDAFKHLDHAEKALVLGSAAGAGINTTVGTGAGRKQLDGTVVDTRLDLEMGFLGLDIDDNTTSEDDNLQSTRKTLPNLHLDKDKLWQLRLLLAWCDRWDREAGDTEDSGQFGDGNDTRDQGWIRREVIERLRWRIWKMAGGEQIDDVQEGGS